MAMGEETPAFPDGPPADFEERQAEEVARLAAYVRPGNLRITNIMIPGSETHIPARLYEPLDVAAPMPLFVWFHGGAFIFGDINMGEAEYPSAEIAARAGAVVLSVDYRLANPNRRFPCSQVDGFDAVIWARNNAHQWNANPEKLFVGGASAGGCLTGSVALMLRDQGVAAAGFLPIYPVAHSHFPDMNDEVRKAVEGVFHFTSEFSELHNPWLVEGMEDGEKYHVWPAESNDLSGQAPFLIVHAERDSLRMTSQLWTQQLRAAGVSVDEFIEPDVLHGYLGLGPESAGANHTYDLMARWIKAH